MTVYGTGIRYWNRKWDPAWNTSTVWPNLRQGIVSMLSGGMTGQFRDPFRSNKPIGRVNPFLAPKGASLGISLCYVFLGQTVWPLPISSLLRNLDQNDRPFLSPDPSSSLVIQSVIFSLLFIVMVSTLILLVILKSSYWLYSILRPRSMK